MASMADIAIAVSTDAFAMDDMNTCGAPAVSSASNSDVSSNSVRTCEMKIYTN